MLKLRKILILLFIVLIVPISGCTEETEKHEKPEDLIGSEWVYIGDAFPWPRKIVLNKDGFILYELFSYDFVSKGDWHYNKKNNSIIFIFKDNINVWKKWLKDNVKATPEDGVIKNDPEVPLAEIKIVEKMSSDKFKIRYLSYFYWGLGNRADLKAWSGWDDETFDEATSKEKWETALEPWDVPNVFDPREYLQK